MEKVALLLIFSAALFWQPHNALPVLAPELQYCHIPLSLPDEEQPFSCCAPQWGRPAIDFDLEAVAAQNQTLKVRRAAHSLSDSEVARLTKAYSLMRALPSGDPRNYDQQANIHCAYCSAVYQQGGNNSTPLQIHGSWLFFAFHRWYIYFHERILAKLLDDDTFALPFWNYDHPDGMTVPFAYVQSPELRDTNREPACLPPATVMVDFYYMNASIRTKEEQIASNLATIYRQVVAAPDTPLRFYGQPYRSGDGPQPGYGTVETMPHNSLHGWTGNQAMILSKDMGALYAAARDPIFYIHHVNIDRLWEVWRTFGREDIEDPDYLDTEFVFYNEDAELVKVKVRDSFDTPKLGYIFEFVDNLWLNMTMSSISNGTAFLDENSTVCSLGVVLLEPCSMLIWRNGTSYNGGVETLVIDGIEGDLSSPAHFNVFVNYPEANLHTLPNCSEFVGRFSAMAQPLQFANNNFTGLKTSARFGLSQNIKDLNLSGEDSLVITIVPNVDSPLAPVSMSKVWIEYELVSSSSRSGINTFVQVNPRNSV